MKPIIDVAGEETRPVRMSRKYANERKWEAAITIKGVSNDETSRPLTINQHQPAANAKPNREILRS